MALSGLNLFYKKTEINNIEQLLNCYSSHEFLSPFRSTIPLIHQLFYNLDTIKQIIPNLESYIFELEYETKVQKGKGRASCTDLMVYNQNKAFCIEAKRTEPLYSNVNRWLSEGESLENRKLVLSGWLELINNRCGTTIQIPDVLDCTYQIIHRFASACNMSGNTELNYYLYNSKNDLDNQDIYQKELIGLRKLFGNSVPIRLYIFNLFPNKLYSSYEINYNGRTSNFSDSIQQLMTEGKFFDISLKEKIEI